MKFTLALIAFASAAQITLASQQLYRNPINVDERDVNVLATPINTAQASQTAQKKP